MHYLKRCPPESGNWIPAAVFHPEKEKLLGEAEIGIIEREHGSMRAFGARKRRSGVGPDRPGDVRALPSTATA